MDVLVLNAGISKAARLQQLLPVLGEGSSIVVISSATARKVVGKPGLENPSILAYASTKGALETLVKHWAAILGPRGIRVDEIAPGVIDTDMSNFTKTMRAARSRWKCRH